nr:MAG TPA: hypothetical protein [Caudoviricetes sp.]
MYQSFLACLWSLIVKLIRLLRICIYSLRELIPLL